MEKGLPEAEQWSRYLAENIRGLREKRNWLQLQLAKAAGIPRSTVTQLESGAGNPALFTMQKISAAL
ncbi:MAG: helix-turn-helix transcriptional regulator, partial [Bdellovibrionota bacterium]